MIDAEQWIEITNEMRVSSSTGFLGWKEYKEDEKVEKAKEKYTKQYLPDEFKDSANPDVVTLFTELDLQFVKDVNDGLFHFTDDTFVEFLDEAMTVNDETYVQIKTESIPALIRFEHELRNEMKLLYRHYIETQKEKTTPKDYAVEMAFLFFLPNNKMEAHTKIVILAEIYHF